MQHTGSAAQAGNVTAVPITKTGASTATRDAAPETDEDISPQLLEYAVQLQNAVQRVTPEEFHWQDSHYGHDSGRGRELLFLIANHEWVRATSEIIDVTRSDAIDTTIKIDIDLDQIIHEAFRERTGRLWLPVIVLPTQVKAEHKPAGADTAQKQAEAGAAPTLDPRYPEPDLFATVTDAAGNLLAMLPQADVRHQISAAMAEIIVNMAVAHWPEREKDWPTATRDQRLLLSAAIYRLLRPAPAKPSANRASDSGQAAQTLRAATSATEAVDVGARTASSRIDTARYELVKLLEPYIRRLNRQSGSTARTALHSEGDPARSAPPGSPKPEPRAAQFARVLAGRAVRVVRALIESVVVVVPIERTSTPIVLTVRVPTRQLTDETAERRRAHHSTWPLRPSAWHLRPVGSLQIDVLLPSADADRQVQINLPDGVSVQRVIRKGREIASQDMIIGVEPPQPMRELEVLRKQLDKADKGSGPTSLHQCLADLAKVKADAVRETLRHYQIASQDDRALDKAWSQLDQVRSGLDQLAGGQLQANAGARLKTEWQEFQQLTHGRLVRRASADSPSPRTVVARSDMIEDIAQRATPGKAQVHVNISVADAEYFSIPRFSGAMALLVMAVILVSFVIKRTSSMPVFSPEVLAIVLTLFPAIQAGRIERPDRSTMRGLLSGSGNWLIVASIFPSVVLAVVLAFSPTGWQRVKWAVGCLILQALLEFFMWRGPLTTTGPALGQRRRRFRTEQVTRFSEDLRSDWWRNTTADALMIGRTAYAYVVWQEDTEDSLKDLLTRARRTSTLPRGPVTTPNRTRILAPIEDRGNAEARDPANVLALLRSGTACQALTFVVFREEPGKDWAKPARGIPLDLDSDRLAPLESVTSTADVFVGVRRSERLKLRDHPMVGILRDAARRLIVLEAQLPVPVPVAGYADRYWARVRVALRDDQDVKRLEQFLRRIRRRATSAQNARKEFVLVVQASPVGVKRILAPLIGGPAQSNSRGRLVLASEMDVMKDVTNREDDTESRTWQILAICADARSNIYYKILEQLSEAQPRLELVGLTYALLHGTAVVLLLGQEPTDSAGQNADLEKELRKDRSLAKLRVLVNEWRSQQELGEAGEYPLLRVHFRSQDRPGALLDVLDSLDETLTHSGIPPQFKSGDWRVWHAQTQVTAGYAASTRLTVRLQADPDKLQLWGSSTFEEIGRMVRAGAMRAAAASSGSVMGDDRQDSPETPVISVSLVEMPTATIADNGAEASEDRYPLDALTRRDLGPASCGPGG